MAGPLFKTSPTHPQSSMNAATGGNGRGAAEGDAASRIPDDAVRRRALSATAQRLHLITSTATRRSDLGCWLVSRQRCAVIVVPRPAPASSRRPGSEARAGPPRTRLLGRRGDRPRLARDLSLPAPGETCCELSERAGRVRAPPTYRGWRPVWQLWLAVTKLNRVKQYWTADHC